MTTEQISYRTEALDPEDGGGCWVCLAPAKLRLWLPSEKSYSGEVGFYPCSEEHAIQIMTNYDATTGQCLLPVPTDA